MSKPIVTTLDCQRFISEFFQRYTAPWDTSGREWIKKDTFREGKMNIYEFQHLDHDIVVRVREFQGVLSIDNHATLNYDTFAENLEHKSQLKFEHFNYALYPAVQGQGYEVMFALGTLSNDEIVSHLKPALYAIFQDVPIAKTYRNTAQGLWIQDLPIEEINHRLQVLGLKENPAFIRTVDPANIPQRSIGPSNYNPPVAQWHEKVVQLSKEQQEYKALQEKRQQQIQAQREQWKQAQQQQVANAPVAQSPTNPSVVNTPLTPQQQQARQSRVQSSVASRTWGAVKNGDATAPVAPQEGRSISAPKIQKPKEGSTSNDNQAGFFQPVKRTVTNTSTYEKKPVWPARNSREAMDYINFYLGKSEIPAFELHRIKEALPLLDTLEYTLVQGALMMSNHILEPAVKMVWYGEVDRRKALKIPTVELKPIESLDLGDLF